MSKKGIGIAGTIVTSNMITTLATTIGMIIIAITLAH
jgi:hypothetical protein